MLESQGIGRWVEIRERVLKGLVNGVVRYASRYSVLVEVGQSYKVTADWWATRMA